MLEYAPQYSAGPPPSHWQDCTLFKSTGTALLDVHNLVGEGPGFRVFRVPLKFHEGYHMGLFYGLSGFKVFRVPAMGLRVK